MRFNRFQEIKTRLLLMILAIVVSLGTSTVLVFNYLNKVEQVENLDQTINAFTMELSELLGTQNKFLLEETTNLYFYKTGKSIYIDRFNQKFNNAGQTLDKLYNLEITSDYNINEDFLEVKSHLQDYKRNFVRLTEQIRKRGSEQYGLIRGMNNTYNKLDSLYHQLPDSVNPGIDFRMLQDFQQKFIMNPRPEYHKRFNKILSRNQEKLSQDTLMPAVLKNKMKVTLASYNLLFNELFQKEDRLGGFSKQGLQNKMEEKVVLVQSATESIVGKIKSKNSKEINDAKNTVITGVMMLLALLLLFVYLIYNAIVKPLRRMRAYINEMVQGKIPEVKIHSREDEVSRMMNSLHTFVNELQKKTTFAHNIGSGDYDAKFSPASKYDQLGNAMLEMQNNLQQARQEEQRHRERDKRNEWVNNSLNDFNNLIKQTEQGITKLSFKLIAKLVEHVGGNQGGIFLYNEESKPPYLDLIASYAYSREKKHKHHVALQEGLVGSCAAERKTIYLDDIPEDYSKIASGLGGARPKYLLIVPLLNGSELLGVMEIASFYKIEEFKVDFIKRLSENIASTFSNIKINQQTQQLLDKTRKQSEELASQEEEMRQNFEELQATQEESAKQQAEMRSIIDAVSASMLYVEYDMEGFVTYVNDAWLQAFGLEKDEVIGKSQVQVEQPNETVIEELNQLWEELKTGTTQKREEKITINENTAWLSRTYAPVLDDNNNPIKVISLAINNTATNKEYEELKSQNEQLEAQEEEMRQTMEQVMQSKSQLEHDKEEEVKSSQETIERVQKSQELMRSIIDYIPAQIHLKDGQGKILLVNQEFARAMDKTPEELNQKTTHDIYDEKTANDIEAEDQMIMRSSTKSFTEEREMNGETYTFLTSKLPFTINDKGKIGILTISRDITQQKEMEKRANDQKEMLKAQEQELKENLKELDKLNKQAKDEKAGLESVILALDKSLSRAEFLPDGSIEETNAIFANLMDYKPEDIKGKPIKNILKPVHKSMLDKIWRNVKNGNTFHDELAIYDKDGNTVYTLSTFIPIIRDDGYIERFFFFGEDITPLRNLKQEAEAKKQKVKDKERQMQLQINRLRKQKDKATEKSRELERLTETMDEALLRCEFNEDYLIESTNTNFAALLNYKPAELKEKPLSDLLVNPEKLKGLQQVIARREPFFGEIYLIAKDQTHVATMAALNAEIDEDDNIASILFMGIKQ